MPNEPKRLAAFRESRAPFGSRTDVGCVRDHNEDSLVVRPPLFVVADGMGGHAAGEVASEIAVQTIAELAPPSPDAEALGAAVVAANAAILEASYDGRGREGMGTTVTAAMLESERLVIAQVGDSRAYLLHQGSLQQITRDHSLVADMVEAGKITPEEARVHPSRSVITRALGSAPGTQPDLYEINVEAGDRLLLCSDGLSSMVRDEHIESVLARVHDPQRCAAQLVNEAIAAGGNDNVTVVVADVAGNAEERRRKMARKTKVTIALVIVILVALIAAAGFGVNYWVNHAAYLSVQDGKVAVYKGVQGSFLGMSFSELQGVTDVSVDDLNPGVAARLADGGIAVESLDAAWNLVDEYEQDAQRDSTTPDGGKTADDAAANTSVNGSTASNGADNASSAAKPQTGAAQ